MRSMKKMAVRLVTFLIVFAMMLSVTSCFGKKEEETTKHEHSYTEEVIAPTCTEAGYTKFTCGCGHSYRGNEIPAGHQMLEVVAKQPTCTEDGEAAFHVCQLCGYVEGNKTVIPALGHLYDTTYEYPTATEAGSKTSICRNCGEKHTQVIEALGAELPEVSKFLAQLIGSIAVTLEATEGTELVYVTEINYPEDENYGTKRSMFVEIAEAVIDTTGEILQARLQVKVGLAGAKLDGVVPSKDVVVNKENAEYVEINVFVNGDVVAISFNDNNTELNMSEMFYDYLAHQMGMNGHEDLLAMLENAYLTSNLEAQLLPLLQKAVVSLTEKVVTIDPAYAEHMAELFAAFGQDLITGTLNGDGTTTYRLDVLAFKKLIAEVEGKTVAEYLETVYGRNVVANMASFFASMPDLTIKEIVNAAVTLAEGTGVEIESIYTLIDLYVYSVSGMEFSIESLIADNYNKSLVDILAEMNGITGAEKLTFVASVKSSFAQVAQVMQTIAIEDLFNSLVPSEEGFFDTLKATLDMLKEELFFYFIIDAEGNLTDMSFTFAGTNFKVELGDGVMGIDATLPNDVEFEVLIQEGGFKFRISQYKNYISVFVYENCFDFSVYQEGEQVAHIYAQNYVGELMEEVIFFVEDDQNRLLDYKHVVVDGVVTELKAHLGGYVTSYEYIYNEEFDEWIEVPETTYVTFWTVDYKDLGEEKHLLVNVESTTIAIYITENGLSLSVLEGEEQVAYGGVTINTETVGEDVIERVSAFLSDTTNELLIYNTVSVNGVVTDAYAAVKGYFVYTEHNHEIVQPEYGYETKPMPEGGFATDEMPEGGGIIVVVPDYSCENCVTVEEYVTWLEVLYTTNDDGTKVLEVNAHDELNNMSEGMDRLTVVIDGDKITAVIGKDDEGLARIELETTETTLVGTITDIQDGANNVMAEFAIELTETLDAIKSVSLIVRDYEYDYTEEGDPIKTIDEIIDVSYEWIDSPEGADYILFNIDGMEFVLGYEVTENGVKIALTEKKDEAVFLEIEVTEIGDAVTLDVLFGTWGRTVADGVVTVSATEDTVTLALDLDYLLIFSNSRETHYAEFEGALQFKLG